MNKSSDTNIKKIEGSLKRFHGEAAASSVETAGINYQSPSLLSAGIGAQGVALMIFLTNLVISLLFIKAPGIIEKMGSKKKVILILALISTFSWIPLILVFILLTSLNTAWLIVLWMVSLVPTALIAPLRDGWLTDLVPVHSLGRYFGLRAMISGIAYLITFYLMARLLDRFSGQASTGYAVILSVAFAAAFCSFFLYRRIEVPPVTYNEQSNFSFADLVKEMRGGSLGAFILFLFIFGLAVNLCSPLFAVYMLKDLHFNYVTYSAIISAEYIARIVSVTFWGKYADRIGNLRLLGVVSRLIPLVPILWLFSSNVGYLLTVQIISGVVWAGFDLCSQTYIFKAAPQSKRLRYLYYYRSLITLSVALGALSGAYLITVDIPVFGNKILGMFLLSGILRFAVVTGMFHKLVDLAWTPRYHRYNSAINQAILNTTLNTGIFHRPEQWACYLKDSSPPNKAKAMIPTKNTGVFRRPEQWACYLKDSSPPNKAKAIIPTKNTGVFRRPEQWACYLKDSLPANKAKAKPETNRVPSLTLQIA